MKPGERHTFHYIRGVYPRGLIEARGRVWRACAARADIRGVYPRGLIEAFC